MERNIVIYQPWGGLGDNLAHSIIPELCSQNNIKCYLSKHNAYRNEDINNFVWELNPYIEKEKIDFTDLSWLDRCRQFENNSVNHIQVLQKVYGFDTDYEYPKIYYTPKYIEEYKDKVLINFTAHSIQHEYDLQKIENSIASLGIKKQNIIYITNSKIGYSKDFCKNENISTIDINDLKTYSDVIASAKQFVALFSGQSVLASTIKYQTGSDVKIDIITPTRYLPHINNTYTFSNTNYIEIK